jgi:hypothetical protein
MTRTDINNLFGRNRTSEQIAGALATLIRLLRLIRTLRPPKIEKIKKEFRELIRINE